MERHPFDLLSLLLGLAVTSLAVVGATDAWRLDPAPWLWPTVLVATGVVLLLAMATASRQPATLPGDATPSVPPDDDLRAQARAELDVSDPLATDGTEPLDPAAGDALDPAASEALDRDEGR